MNYRLILGAFVLTASTLGFALGPDDTFQGVVVKQPFNSHVGHSNPAKTPSTQILYHGGPVMNRATSVFVIYYGTFPSSTQPIINNFLVDLSNSAPYRVNTTYSDMGQPNTPVPGFYTFVPPAGAPAPNLSESVFWDSNSQGSQLGTNSIPKIVTHALNNGLRADENGVYLVVTGSDVKISGFCTSFCAYHTTSTSIYGALHIRFALIPAPSQRCTGCNGNIAVYNDATTPNGDMAADTMTDDIMHELSETVTDPDLNAWFTKNGAENADLCNYVYGASPLPTAPNGAHYNFSTTNGHYYLIQQLWKNDGAGYCASQ